MLSHSTTEDLPVPFCTQRATVQIHHNTAEALVAGNPKWDKNLCIFAYTIIYITNCTNDYTFYLKWTNLADKLL